MIERDFNRLTLQPNDASLKHKFTQYRYEYSTFKWQCVWLTGAIISMLIILIIRRTTSRLVILAFELAPAIVAWLLQCFEKRVSKPTYGKMLSIFFIAHQVYISLVTEVLMHMYGEEIYLLGYILRLYESYVVFVQYQARNV